MPRIWEIDFFRGIAIIMMIVFHFLWDLKYFNFVSFPIYSGFWGAWQLITASLFLFLVGISLTLSYNRNKKDFRERFLKKGGILFAGGLLITLVTLIAFPEIFIYFGILHFIGFSIILSIPFIERKISNLILGVILILLPLIFALKELQIIELFWLGFATPVPTLDFFPVIPWFGVVLLGLFVGNTFYEKGISKLKIKKPEMRIIGFVEKLGKHALIIYFLHQLILFPLVYVLSTLI
ncbi:MAG: heparan-alpha-glucosaminide N-acetyltransferase [Candidatus Diapherotrites archaeon]